MAIFFAILALIGWGVGDIFSAIVSRKIGGKLGYFWWSIFGCIIALLYLPFAPKLTDYPMLFIAFLIGNFLSIGTLLYFRGLEVGNASLVGTLGGAYPVVTVPLAMILFGEHLQFLQIVGIGCIIAGLMLASLQNNAIQEIRSGKIFSDRGVVFGLTAMVIWGIGWALMKIPVVKIGWYWAAFPGYFFWAVLPFLGMVKGKVFGIFSDTKTLLALFIASLLITLGGFAFNIGLSLGFASIVSSVGGLSPVLFVVIAYFVFGDRMNKRQKTGVITSLLGIILVSFSSI